MTAEVPKICRVCRKEYSLKHPEKLYAEVHKRKLKRFRLTPKEYSAMLAAQHGICAICPLPPMGTRFAVDHDHQSGKIRGLLCRNCNLMLGFAMDDVRRLRSALCYLEKHK